MLKYEMKRRIKKLLYFSFIAFISIGINFDAETRVTREVAEATLPYLMKAAGIPEDARPNPDTNSGVPYYSQAKRDAIICMIYTDEGQQQMIKWGQEGVFPSTFTVAGFESAETYKNNVYRNVSLASLFPCSTTTFTSFANHRSRLGSHILSNPKATDEEKDLKNILKFFESVNNAEAIISNINQANKQLPIDTLLAKVIFILDICDSLQQINKLLGLNLAKCLAKSEYLCRPVSAIAALEGKSCEGDCVETLYRHLINIAIQDIDCLEKFHTEKLCDNIYKYYYSNYKKGDPKEIVILESVSEAGLTSIARHTEWKKYLKEVIGENCSSIGSVNNIARGISTLASSEIAINDEETIKSALNKLSSGNKCFDIKIKGKAESSPDWVTKTIIIIEKQSEEPKRTIIVGINEELKTPSEGHAEILSITTY